ncbi:hypothetical protein [Geomonas subterranea]|uniref:hypothetical protein n=1 Tax=Geomonas subterranea TaxID=2847989 RepID=UPI001CD76621|nr:hypothetical protein [Geomonas fuzhouensis]
MAGIPAWAAVLAAPYAADKLIADPVGSIYGTYKAIRDDQADQNDKQATMDLLKQFTAAPNMTPDMKMLSKFRNPAAADEALKGALKLAGKIQEQQSIPQVNTLQNYANETGTTDPRFYNDPASQQELQRQGFNGDLSFFSKGYSQNPVTNSAARDIENLQRLGATQRRIAAGTANPNDYADLAMNPQAEKMDKVLNTNMSALKENRAVAQKAQDKGDIAGFQSDIAGLTGPSKSPLDLTRFSKRGGYAPFSEVESDIRQAAAARNVGDSDEVNKAVDAAKGVYKDTYLPPEEGKIGRTTFTGQTNLLGDFRKDVQNVAPVVKIDNGDKGAKEERRDFNGWITKLQTLRTREAGIQKGYDPILNQYIAPANMDAALATVREEIANTKGYLEANHGERYRVYSKGSKKQQTQKTLDADTARFILNNAGGDRELARKLAREQGYDF